MGEADYLGEFDHVCAWREIQLGNLCMEFTVLCLNNTLNSVVSNVVCYVTSCYNTLSSYVL